MKTTASLAIPRARFVLQPLQNGRALMAVSASLYPVVLLIGKVTEPTAAKGNR